MGTVVLQRGLEFFACVLLSSARLLSALTHGGPASSVISPDLPISIS